MFQKQEFIKPVYSLKELPENRLPSLVISGRSNVGKSSFINSFFNRKDLAKASSTPGKTRSINFYLIDGKFYLVDLPGIGYAKTSKTETATLGKLISDFLIKYDDITQIFHLIDSRHKPTALDLELDGFIEANGHSYSIIMTKTDKLKQSEMADARKNIKIYYPDKKINESIFFYSSFNRTGKKEVASKVASLFY